MGGRNGAGTLSVYSCSYTRRTSGRPARRRSHATKTHVKTKMRIPAAAADTSNTASVESAGGGEGGGRGDAGAIARKR